MDVLYILGVLHITEVAVGIFFFLYLLGIFNPSWDEPYPRSVQWSYPSSNEKHWFLQIVNQTALRRDWYTTSISQYVGARGTTGAKLMVQMTTTIAISQLYIVLMLYSQDIYHTDTVILACISCACVYILGFCESALYWTLPIEIPPMKDIEDQHLIKKYANDKQITPLTEDEDTLIKDRLSIVHTTVAILFILLQFTVQIIHGHVPEIILAFIGLFTFVFFCIIQWLSGVNDNGLGCLAIKNISWIQCMYYPQGTLTTPRSLKTMSWFFLSFELIAFAVMSALPGFNAILN